MPTDLNSSAIAVIIAFATFIVIVVSATGRYIESRLKTLQEQAAAQAKLDTQEKQQEIEQKFKQQGVIEDTLQQQLEQNKVLLGYFGRAVEQWEAQSSGIRTVNFTLEQIKAGTTEPQVKVSETLDSIEKAVEDGNTGINGKLDKLIAQFTQVIEMAQKSPAVDAPDTVKIMMEIRDFIVKKAHDTGEMKAVVDTAPKPEIVGQN